jgi:hypothetical protein
LRTLEAHLVTLEDKLREIIVAYGDHLFDCRARVDGNCSCGYTDALNDAAPAHECCVFDCDRVPTVSVRWTGADKDLFRFCDEHDPRKAGEQ